LADPTSRNAPGHYWTPAIGAYVERLFAAEEPGMLDAVAAIKAAGMPEIQVAPSDGRILELLLRMVGARKVVELGTLAGYSAQWIARALPLDGHLWTIEASPKHAEVSRGVLARAGLADRVTVLDGTGLATLPLLEPEAPFDAVFVDADKESYGEYAGWAVRNLRLGGLVIGDNCYLFGRLAGVEPENDGEAARIASMQTFHELLARECHAVVIPTPDGLTVGIKR
jgi:caffeoyl-CoA O-methyltransferase